MNNPGKTLNIYNIPKLAKVAYFESFSGRNITRAFEKTGIWPFNKLAFGVDDFAAVSVYQSGSTSAPEEIDEIGNVEDVEQQDLPPGLAPTSASFPPQSESAQGEQSISTASQGANVSEMELTQEDLLESLVPVSPSLHRSTTTPATLPAGGLITPEVIRLYPIVDRTESKKGKQQGK